MKAEGDKPRKQAEKRIAGAVWSDIPPLPLDWFGIEGENAEALIARLDAATDGSDIGVFSSRHSIGRIRAAELPFYNKHLLLDIETTALGPADKLLPALASVLYGPSGPVFLDGSSLPIHAQNAQHLKIKNEESALSYLRFFCAFVRGEDGPFRILGGPEDCQFVPGTKAATKAKVLKIIEPPLIGENKAEGRGWVALATVHYADTLFRSSFQIEPTGMIEMLDDTPILENAPLVRRQFRDAYRFFTMD